MAFFITILFCRARRDFLGDRSVVLQQDGPCRMHVWGSRAPLAGECTCRESRNLFPFFVVIPSCSKRLIDAMTNTNTQGPTRTMRPFVYFERES